MSAGIALHTANAPPRVNQLPAELPKVDFAALKKQLPAQASIIDSLQKQYEAVKVPYGAIPEQNAKEISKWQEFHVSQVRGRAS